MKEGETLFVALVVERATRPATLRGGLRAARVDRAPLAALARPRRRSPTTRGARYLQRSALDAEGPDLRADRRAGRRRHDVAARDARRRAQLGLPLHAGSATPRSRCGASTRSASTGRPTTSSTSSPTSPRPTTSDLQIMYGIGGERELAEQTLDHLSGYEGARPVRIGNGAYDQDQHDVWGAVLDSVYLHTKSRDHLDERIWPILERQVEAALAHWREPDRGIWEVRGEPKHFTSSKVMCWVALRPRRAARRAARGARDGAALAGGGRRDPRRHLRERASTSAACSPSTTTPTRSTRRCCSCRWCASCRPTTSASARTVLAIADELTDDGLVLRYRVDETDDGLQRRGGHVHDLLVLARLGARRDRRDRRGARALCEKLLSYASPLALYAEEIDPRSGPPPRQLPAGVHPPGADQRRDARDPRRERGRPRGQSSSAAAARSRRQPARDGRFGTMNAASAISSRITVSGRPTNTLTSLPDPTSARRA